MSDGFADPHPPPDATERLKATDLVGQNCLLLPTGEGMWPAREATEATETEKAQRAQPPRPYVECSVWTLDRAGIVAHEDGVRISWWRTIDNLKAEMGKHIGCRPTKDTDNSIYLQPLSKDIRPVAKKVYEELTAKSVVDELGGEEVPEGEETF